MAVAVVAAAARVEAARQLLSQGRYTQRMGVWLDRVAVAVAVVPAHRILGFHLLVSSGCPMWVVAAGAIEGLAVVVAEMAEVEDAVAVASRENASGRVLVDCPTPPFSESRSEGVARLEHTAREAEVQQTTAILATMGATAPSDPEAG